jgi:membrane associated rhomboid family serine protease
VSYGESPAEKAIYWLTKDRIPVTKGLIIVTALATIATSLFARSPFWALLTFSSDWWARWPWTFFTYPLLGAGPGDIVGLLFSCYWLWIAAGSVERAWGSTRFTTFFFGMSAITALGLLAGHFLTQQETWAFGMWLPLAGVTVAFAMMNPEQVILFMFFLPMKLKYLALLDVGIVFASYLILGWPNGIVIGLCALSGCAFSYLLVTRGSKLFVYRSASRPQRGEVIRIHRRKSRFNPLTWFKEQREEKRLRDFLDK